MSRGNRLGLLGVAVVIAIVAVVIAISGGDDNKDKSKSTGTVGTSTGAATGTTTPKPKPKPVAITVRNGTPVGGIRKIDVKEGDRVRFSVTSDVADEVHVHGYDFHKDVTAGGKVSFNFPAKIAGGFEVELEALKEQIAELTVRP